MGNALTSSAVLRNLGVLSVYGGGGTMKTFLSLSFFSAYLFGCASLLANSDTSTAPVIIEHGKYSDSYHIRYTLTSDNFDMQKNGGGFSSEDGQFEIYLNKKEFPIASPNCKIKLVLRMPSTLSDDANRNASIDNKKRLYDEIKNVHEKKSHALDVAIALSPYVKVKSKTPLVLELEDCNVFFRTEQNHGIGR